MTFDRLMQLAMRGALIESDRLGLSEEGTVTFLKDLGWEVVSLKKEGRKMRVTTEGVFITEIPAEMGRPQATTATSESDDVSDPKSSVPAD